ncbi:MAG: hypothetical protein CL666_16405 [Balneola sp.]|nr:hypothetical protein [Balneola sp.]
MIVDGTEEADLWLVFSVIIRKINVISALFKCLNLAVSLFSIKKWTSFPLYVIVLPLPPPNRTCKKDSLVQASYAFRVNPGNKLL